jgi:4-hydroxybenzoate polyprenyltransferase
MWIFYSIGFFWTVAYDSVYGFQDIKDDAKVGIQSMSQTLLNMFGPKGTQVFLAYCYVIMLVLSIWGFHLEHQHMYDTLTTYSFLKKIFFFGDVLFLGGLMIYFIRKSLRINLSSPQDCCRFFYHNTWLGSAVGVTLVDSTIAFPYL